MTQAEKQAVQDNLDEIKRATHRGLERAAAHVGLDGRKLAIARTHVDTAFAVMRDALADVPLTDA